MSNDIAKDAAELAAIGERLRTQDNRCTASPMFCVQVKRTVYGMDPEWSDAPVWIDTEDGAHEVPAPADEEETDFIIKTGKFEYWETVMVAFTEEGCKEHLRLNGHNYRSGSGTRIYAESFNRCPEMLAIREALMSGIFTATAADKERMTMLEEDVEAARLERDQLRAQLAEKTQECEGLRDSLSRCGEAKPEAIAQLRKIRDEVFATDSARKEGE